MKALLDRLIGRRPYSPPRYQSFAFYRSQVYFPTIAVTPMGLYREIDPVQILPPTEVALAEALGTALSSSRPRVKEYLRGDPPLKNPIQVAARCPSWSSFARASLRCGVVEADTSWHVSVFAENSPENTGTRYVPKSSPIAELVKVVMELAAIYPLWRPSDAKRSGGS